MFFFLQLEKKDVYGFDMREMISESKKSEAVDCVVDEKYVVTDTFKLKVFFLRALSF